MSERHSAWIDEEQKIDLLAVLKDMGKRTREIWWVAVLLILAGIFVGFLWEKTHYTPRYEAVASFSITVEGQNSAWTSGYYNRVSSRQLNAAFPYLLTSGALSQVVAEDLGVAVVPAQISASMVGDTNIFQIKTVAEDAQTAYEVLQSVVKNYPEVARYVIGDTRLELLDDGGVAQEPLNQPEYLHRMLQGALISVLIVFVLVLIRTATGKTIKTGKELKAFLQMPCLAEVPQVNFRKWNRKRPEGMRWPMGYREAMDTLQIRLLQIMRQKNWNLLMVTSTLAGEGKTTTACNLALALAAKGHQVLLVDADLRHPSVASVLHLKEKEGETGFCDVLLQRSLAAGAIRSLEDNGLHVLPGGKPVADPVGMYTEQDLRELLEELQQMADYVIVDGPPCGILSDTVQMVSCMDAALFVIRQDYGSREKILYGAELLAQSRTPLAGCVLNGASWNSGTPYGGYVGEGYRSYGKKSTC